MDRITQDAKRPERTPSASCQGVNMNAPIKHRSKKYAQILNMGGGREGKGGRTKSKRDCHRLGAFMMRGMGRMKEHKFQLIQIDTETDTGKPVPTERSKTS